MQKPDTLFLSEQHPENRRWAILEDDGTCAWLYVTPPGSEAPEPEADCFVYNRIPPVPDSEVRSYVSRGLAPQITTSFASDRALQTPQAGAVALQWQGDCAVVTLDGVRWATLQIGQKSGRSLAIGREGPFGNPLRQDPA